MEKNKYYGLQVKPDKFESGIVIYNSNSFELNELDVQIVKDTEESSYHRTSKHLAQRKEQALIQQRMAESGIRNMGAYMRKMALNGYVLHVDLSPVRELVSLQRRCSNNLNQVAIQANTYGGIYPEEIAALQRDYAALWGPLSDLLKKLSALVEL